MMNKKIFTIIFLVMGLLSLSACSSENNADTANTSETTEGETGYPSGEVQRPYLVYEGELYQHTFENRKISKDKISEEYPGYEYVASIEKISNKEMPDEELEASRFSEGTEIYANGESIIVYDNGFVKEMEKVND